MSARPIVAFSDGASKGNPGPGGWGVVIVTPDGLVIELRRIRAAHTTNNRMELTGAIEALSEVREIAGQVAVYTDSTYVIKGISEWIWAWRRRGWKTAEGNDVSNRDLWEQLAGLVDARGKGASTGTMSEGTWARRATSASTRLPTRWRAAGRRRVLSRVRSMEYGLAVLELPADTDVPKRSSTVGTRQGGRQPTRISASSMGNSCATRHGPSASGASRAGRARGSRRPRMLRTKPPSCGNGRLTVRS